MADADAAGEEKGKAVAGAELEDESVYREKEGKELDALIHPDVKADVGCSTTGQYELVGECCDSAPYPFIHRVPL